MTTLATQWQQHADATLPIDTPEADVRAAKRAWYGAQLDRLAQAPKTAENQALLQEAVQFGRLIGTPLETA